MIWLFSACCTLYNNRSFNVSLLCYSQSRNLN
nr:MAG TPA: hypothetical protein [Crassvirales sp.]